MDTYRHRCLSQIHSIADPYLIFCGKLRSEPILQKPTYFLQTIIIWRQLKLLLLFIHLTNQQALQFQIHTHILSIVDHVSSGITTFYILLGIFLLYFVIIR